MAQTIFYPGLDEFCRKYLVEGRPLTRQDTAMFPMIMQQQQHFIFEQLLLFDHISFKVYGENIAIPLLINFFGEKGFEALIEEGAIRFVLWTPMIGYMLENIPGIEGMVCGDVNSPAHSDPLQSIDLGFNWLSKPITSKQKKRLAKKVLAVYSVTKQGMAQNSLNTVKSAFLSGKLRHYGLDPGSRSLENLTSADKETLTRCAEDLLEYEYLIQNNMTSFSDYKFYSPFWDTAQRFKEAKRVKEGFWQISAMESFPNLAAVFNSMDEPFKKLPRLRNTRNARRFRQWLATTSTHVEDEGFIRQYIDSVSERKGLFDTAPAKFLKAAVMTAIGAGIGAAAGAEAGALAGAAGGLLTEKTLELASDFGLDIVDSFVLESIAKGWSPRMFFNDINRLKITSSI